MSDKRCILWHRSQRSSSDSANSISGQPTLLSCQCRNALQEDHCGNNLSFRNGWFLGYMGALGIRALSRPLPSPLKGLNSLWEALFPCCFLVARRVVASCLRYWQYKDCQGLFRLGRYSKTSSVGKRQSFHIWGPGGEGRVDSSRLKDQIIWLRRTIGGARSWRF